MITIVQSDMKVKALSLGHGDEYEKKYPLSKIISPSISLSIILEL